MMRRRAHLGPHRSQLRNVYRQGIIRSIQRGTVTTNNQLTNTATITAVDVANSILVYQELSSAGGTADQTMWRHKIELTNATTVTATVAVVEAVAHVVSFEVVEYWPGTIRSLQRGLLASVTSASATATITAVNVNKSQLFGGGMTVNTNTGGAANSTLGRLSLTNSTTVTFDKATATATWSVPYQVVEWF